MQVIGLSRNGCKGSKLHKYQGLKCDMFANFRDTQEWSALCFAADRGRGDAARILLEAGADPDSPTKGPRTYDICRGGGILQTQAA